MYVYTYWSDKVLNFKTDYPKYSKILILFLSQSVNVGGGSWPLLFLTSILIKFQILKPWFQIVPNEFQDIDKTLLINRRVYVPAVVTKIEPCTPQVVQRNKHIDDAIFIITYDLTYSTLCTIIYDTCLNQMKSTTSARRV